MVTDSTPINAAIFETEKGLNAVLRPQRCFNVQTTFLSVSACFISVLIFCSFTHIVQTDRHTHTHNHNHKYKNISVLGTDPHFSCRQFACLASKWTCLTPPVYMMTNPTFNLLCLFAASTNFFYLINDRALKATKC